MVDTDAADEAAKEATDDAAHKQEDDAAAHHDAAQGQ